MSSTGDLSREMGRRMLQGWAMLAQHCPNDTCAVPLLRSPDRSHTLCIGCGTQFPLNSQGSAPAPAASSAPGSAPAPQRPPAGSRPSTLGTLRPFLGPALANGTAQLMNGPVPDTASPPAAASAVGRALLEATAAPSTGQRRSGQDLPGRFESPLPNGIHGHEADSDGSSEAEVGRDAGPGEGAGAGPGSMDLDAGGNAALGRGQGASADGGVGMGEQGDGAQGGMAGFRVSARGGSSNPVSERLLQGWAMLDSSCPQCFNPFMRSRLGETCCVVCPAQPSSTSAPEPVAQQPSDCPAGPSPSLAAPSDPTTEATDSRPQRVIGQGPAPAPGSLMEQPQSQGETDSQEAVTLSKHQQHQEQQQQQQQEQRPSGVLGLGQVSSLDPAAVFRSTHATLVAKMHDLTRQLQLTTEPSRSTEVIRAISECSVAVKNLHELL